MIKTVNTFPSITASGVAQVKIGIRIKSCTDRDGYIQIGEDNYRGVGEIQVSYFEILNDEEREMPARNDLDNKIVVPMQVRDSYIESLENNPLDGLIGYDRMERKDYIYLLKYFSSINLFGITDIEDWELVF